MELLFKNASCTMEKIPTILAVRRWQFVTDQKKREKKDAVTNPAKCFSSTGALLDCSPAAERSALLGSCLSPALKT